jgi:hypothetical protein
MSTVRPVPAWLGKADCKTCKYYSKGRCRLFIEKIEKSEIMFARVEDVRADEKMCGPKGVFWSSSDFDPDQIWYQDVLWTQE